MGIIFTRIAMVSIASYKCQKVLELAKKRGVPQQEQ